MKAKTSINWKIEDENIKYRSLFDRIYKAEKRTTNRLYNIIYLIAKTAIAITVVFELDSISRILTIVFPFIFLIHDII